MLDEEDFGSPEISIVAHEKVEVYKEWLPDNQPRRHDNWFVHERMGAVALIFSLVAVVSCELRREAVDGLDVGDLLALAERRRFMVVVYELIGCGTIERVVVVALSVALPPHVDGLDKYSVVKVEETFVPAEFIESRNMSSSGSEVGSQGVVREEPLPIRKKSRTPHV